MKNKTLVFVVFALFQILYLEIYSCGKGEKIKRIWRKIGCFFCNQADDEFKNSPKVAKGSQYSTATANNSLIHVKLTKKRQSNHYQNNNIDIQNDEKSEKITENLPAKQVQTKIELTNEKVCQKKIQKKILEISTVKDAKTLLESIFKQKLSVFGILLAINKSKWETRFSKPTLKDWMLKAAKMGANISSILPEYARVLMEPFTEYPNDELSKKKAETNLRRVKKIFDKKVDDDFFKYIWLINIFKDPINFKISDFDTSLFLDTFDFLKQQNLMNAFCNLLKVFSKNTKKFIHLLELKTIENLNDYVPGVKLENNALTVNGNDEMQLITAVYILDNVNSIQELEIRFAEEISDSSFGLMSNCLKYHQHSMQKLVLDLPLSDRNTRYFAKAFNFPNLEHLELRGMQFDQEMLYVLFDEIQRCSLVSFSMGLPKPNSAILDSNISFLAMQKCVVSVNVKDCGSFSDNSALLLCDFINGHCAILQSLIIDVAAVQKKENLIDIYKSLQNCTNLQSLTLNIWFPNEDVDKEFITAVLGIKSLQKVDFGKSLLSLESIELWKKFNRNAPNKQVIKN